MNSTVAALSLSPSLPFLPIFIFCQTFSIFTSEVMQYAYMYSTLTPVHQVNRKYLVWFRFMDSVFKLGEIPCVRFLDLCNIAMNSFGYLIDGVLLHRVDNAILVHPIRQAA